MSVAEDLAESFQADLSRVRLQIESFRDEGAIWKTLPGITNPAGNLVLHLEGNLREYVGRLLGGVAYTRDRPLEFAAKDISKAELCARIAGVEELVPAVVETLSTEQMEKEFPVVVLASAMSTQQFLIHLYGHLNWHLGQIDYLRRILEGGGA